MAEYTEDLFAGFSDPRGAKVCAGATASLGRAVGELLVRRIGDLGQCAFCMGTPSLKTRCFDAGREGGKRTSGTSEAIAWPEP